jgi:Pectate lyase superfamily protein
VVINVKDFGAMGDGAINPNADDTIPIQQAVEAANTGGGGIIFFPPGTYVIDGVKNTSSVQNIKYGILLHSNLRFVGSGWSSIVKLKKNSTADTTVNPYMFFAGPSGRLSDLAFENMAFYGNSAHNELKIGPPDGRNVCAIFIGDASGNDKGVALNGLRVHSCLFIDWPGTNVIVVHDRRTTGSFSRDFLIDGNTFYDNRKADNNRDHSTVNIFADNTRVVNNLFALPSTATKLQKQVACACELHGSASCFSSNTLEWYAVACIFSQNLHHDCLSQSAIGNVCSNMTYRVFDLAVSAFDPNDPHKFKTINQINVTGNTIHFNAIEPIQPRYGAPFKWAMSFYIREPFVVDSLTFANNVVDGDTLHQKVGPVAFDPDQPKVTQTVPVTTIGIGGLWDGGGDSYWGLTHLNVIGNEFRQMRYGVWQDCLNLATIAKHSSIVGNRFEDFADPTHHASATAVGVFYTSNGAQPGIKSVNIAHNHFVNEWNHASYKYGIYLDNTIFFPSIGENWYYQIKSLNNGWGPMSAVAVISRPAIPNTIFAMYGTAVTIDWGQANRFFIAVTDTTPFTVSTPNISGTAAVPVDGTEIEVTLRNASGGVMGNLTWGDRYKTSWNNGADKPVNGFNRTIRFRYSSLLGVWVETSKTPVDVPN